MDDFAAFAAFGTTLTIDSTPVYGIGDVTGPQFSTDVSDVTNHSSPNATEQRVATVKRVGTISFPMVTKSDDAGQQALYDGWQSRDASTFVLTKPSGIVHTFDAYITGFADAAPVTGHESIDVVLTPLAWDDDATVFPSS